MPACGICGKAEDACQLANSRVAPMLRHDYEPGRSYVHTLIAPTHELRPSTGKRAMRKADRHTQPSLGVEA